MTQKLITPERARALSNMYSLVGTHSAVKLCRWQKSMMRGRGGCYKWTFYGIKSHQCMEATPNIACANKCVFCWRLNTNPSMKEWKWSVDDPKQLVSDLIAQHKALIRNSSGMPGVTAEALTDALDPKHCALSLVGEPIAYPKINEFVGELHRRSISTFLVNNGQFPEFIESLNLVTQLYLSVDSPTKEKMLVLDRPIFRDAWERFNESVRLMRNKGRTVFRLTLIQGFNMEPEDIGYYAQIVESGKPHFIELKALTPAFNGSRRTFLRISNVPTLENIVAFGERLCGTIGGGASYKIACVHEQSKCLLLAHRSYQRGDGGWATWIDFNRFHKIVCEENRHAIGESPDYIADTPGWALFGGEQAGFDPQQKRHVSSKRKKYLVSDPAVE